MIAAVRDAAVDPFAAADWIVMFAYLAAMFGLAVYFLKGQKDTTEFFLASRSMSWLPIGLSLTASLISCISYLGQPSGYQTYGMVMAVGAIPLLVVIPFVNRVVVPFFRGMNLNSAYEYLEHRYDYSVRAVTAGIFILWRLSWMGTAIYVPSVALWAATGGTVPVRTQIIVIGALTTIYTALGGIKAVIWTDVVQTIVMLGGTVLIVGFMVANVDGGWSEVWAASDRAELLTVTPEVSEMDAETTWLGKLGAYFTQPSKITFWGIMIGGLVSYLSNYMADQVGVQRYLTAKSVAHARRALWANFGALLVATVLFTLVGMGALAYFAQTPPPETLADQPFQQDWRLPYFIATVLPAGIGGLLIAALLAATMSSIDSGINSCCSVVVNDFWLRTTGESGGTSTPPGPARARMQLFLSRALTLVFGAVATVLACYVGQLGDIIEIANRLINLFGGPMVGIFLLGMLSRRSEPIGTCTGAIVGTVVCGIASLGKYVNMMWPAPIGLIVTLLVGWLVSLCFKPPGEDKLRWSYAGRTELPPPAVSIAPPER